MKERFILLIYNYFNLQIENWHIARSNLDWWPMFKVWRIFFFLIYGWILVGTSMQPTPKIIGLRKKAPPRGRILRGTVCLIDWWTPPSVIIHFAVNLNNAHIDDTLTLEDKRSEVFSFVLSDLFTWRILLQWVWSMIFCRISNRVFVLIRLLDKKCHFFMTKNKLYCFQPIMGHIHIDVWKR